MKLRLLAALAAATHYAAAVSFTNSDYSDLKSGTPFTITWEGDGSPVTIKLLTGPPNNLQPVTTLSTSASGTTLTFTPSPSLPSGSYAFSISQSGTTNYSPQFSLTSSSTPSPSPPSNPPTPPVITNAPILPGQPLAWSSSYVNATCATATGTGTAIGTAPVGSATEPGYEIETRTIAGKVTVETIVSWRLKCKTEGGCKQDVQPYTGAAVKRGVSVAGLVIVVAAGVLGAAVL